MKKFKWSKLAIAACAMLLAIPVIAADKPATRRTAWKPETVSGKIMEVDLGKRLVVVETRDGVPFDMVVSAKTRIKSGDRGVALQDLRRDTDKTVSVTFTPERRGDVARLIQING